MIVGFLNHALLNKVDNLERQIKPRHSPIVLAYLILKENRGDKMDIKEMGIGDIKPYENNPRKNDDAVPYVAKSIEEFGFKVPIVVDKDNIIVAGHTRYKAAKKLKLETVPVIIADDLTDEQIKAFRLADNKVAEQAEWDFDLLDEELDDILNIDMEDFGFDFGVNEEEQSGNFEESDFNYENKYAVTVMCKDELDQEKVYNSLTEQGYECKVVVVLKREYLFVKKEWDYHDLWAELFPIGIEMVSSAVKDIEAGNTKWEKQDESVATWEPSWERPRLKRNDLVMIG